MLKALFHIFLLGTITIPSSYSENLDIYQTLDSKKTTERLETLQNIKHSTEKALHQKLIDMALFDESPEVRIEAEYTLANIQPMSFKDLKLRIHLSSVFPSEQIAALKSLENMANVHPFIQYTLLKEFIFRSISFNRNFTTRTVNPQLEIKKQLNLEVQQELIRIAASYPYLQHKLLLVITSDEISETARLSAKEILKRIFESLNKEMKEELVRITTTDTVSKIAQSAAADILIGGFKFLHSEAQRELIHKATSDTVSETAQTMARDILIKRFTFIKPEKQRELIHKATSPKSSYMERNSAQYILIRGSKWAGDFVDLEMQQELLRKATYNIASEIERNSARDILMKIFELVEEKVQQELVFLATSDKISEVAQGSARSILLESEFRHSSLTIEEELLRIAISDTASEIERNAAKNILLRRMNYNSIANLNEKVQEELAYIATSRGFSRIARKTALDILIQVEHIQPTASSFKLKCQIAFRKLFKRF